MEVKAFLESAIQSALAPSYLDVIDESYMHNVPEGSESHFKVIIVSDKFTGQRLIGRHRQVNQVLADELANHIHALSIHTYTIDEWNKQNQVAPDSPMCLGGSK